MKTEMSIIVKFVVIALITLTFVSCKTTSTDDPDPDPSRIVIEPGPQAQAQIQEAFINAGSGYTIELTEGVFELTAMLTMDDKAGVVITGHGRDKTILSFAAQTDGSNGILITNSEQIVVKHLRILDAPGDALKVRDTNGVVIYNVETVWSGEPKTENGAYGIYPVLSSNILIDNCYAYGASDAGIYVGQSTNAIVRNSKAEGNVAGIEIENTINADVYNNTVTGNTGGILVFDLPGLTQSGSHIRVFNNTVHDNGRKNFAPAGSIVSEVPAGTGILVLATKNVEVFDNEIETNNLIGAGVFSFNSMIALGIMPIEMHPSFNPANIHFHGNSFTRNNTFVGPEEQPFFGQVMLGIYNELPSPDFIPHLLIDGFFMPESGESGSVCMENNTGASTFMNLNIPHDFPNNISMDPSPHNCTMDPLPAVTLVIPEFTKR
jgi:parallel beta-helix repeat protein